MSFAVSAAVLLTVATTSALAQGGGGRSESVRAPTVSVDRAERPSKRSFRPARNAAPKIVVPATGSLVIRVNEGASQLRIFRGDTPIETIDVPDRSTSLIIRPLEVGSYTVVASKPGFHDESRAVEIEKGEGHRVAIDLRPEMAILSVSSNVPDAKISIKGLGVFERRVEKALVRPGRYHVRASRRGYISREVSVELTKAGSEESLNLILEPLRVDAVVNLIFENIRNGKHADAEALAMDVLDYNPRHARANLALAFVYIERDETQKAVGRVLQAISSGETFSLLVRVRVQKTDENTVPAVIKLDSRSLTIESPERPGLNFSIKRANLGRPDIEGNAIIISGHAEYHGRTISPRLEVYMEHLETIRALLSEWQK